jgi:RNA methyltransferase, TrmH family
MAKKKVSKADPQPGRPAAKPRHRAASEETYHGLRASEALFARRPDDIIRVYLLAGRKQRFAELLAFCAKARKGFQVVEEENLRRITGSMHHEGVAILAREIPRFGLARLLETGGPTPGGSHPGKPAAGGESGPILFLDGVENPHNLGSILRTAAHFGVAAVAGRAGQLPPLSPAAVRVAEGAAECVPVCDLADPQGDLRKLVAAGFRVVAASSHRGASPAATSLGGRCVIVLGSEGQGVSAAIDRVATDHVQIPGTGAVESLNVSVACGVLLAEAWRHAHSVDR